MLQSVAPYLYVRPHKKADCHCMRQLASLLNIALLLFVVYMLIDKGPPRKDDLPIFILLIATPIVSLIALRFGDTQDWISLFFKRKAMEERKKIDELGRRP
jgi:hypothetical protein